MGWSVSIFYPSLDFWKSEATITSDFPEKLCESQSLGMTSCHLVLAAVPKPTPKNYCFSSEIASLWSLLLVTQSYYWPNQGLVTLESHFLFLVVNNWADTFIPWGIVQLFFVISPKHWTFFLFLFTHFTWTSMWSKALRLWVVGRESEAQNWCVRSGWGGSWGEGWEKEQSSHAAPGMSFLSSRPSITSCNT